MKKKIVLGIAAAGTALAMIPMFAAFEAHVINVTATIENALSVDTDPIEFGTVFPEELLVMPLSIQLSQSFQEEDRVDDVEYMIRQKPKCGLPIADTDPVQYSEFAQVTHTDPNNTPEDPTDDVLVCPGNDDTDTDEDGVDTDTDGPGFVELPLLCPFISKHDDQTPDNDGSIDSFHGPLTDWDMGDTIATQVLGRLSKLDQDLEDIWDIDLHVPCFSGFCAQDNVIPEDYQIDIDLEHSLFGCDLWIEVTEVSETPDQPTTGTITIIKVVTPEDNNAGDQGADLTAADFQMFIDGNPVPQ